MFARLADFVARHWLAVIAIWAAVGATTVMLTPRWDDVTYDGDLAYMPASMTSVKAEQLLEQAFPRRRSKSEMVVLASRENEPLTNEDLRVIDRLAARLHNLLGVSLYREAEASWRAAAEQRQLGNDAQADRLFQQADELQRQASASWEESLELDSHLSDALNNRAFYFQCFGADGVGRAGPSFGARLRSFAGVPRRAIAPGTGWASADSGRVDTPHRRGRVQTPQSRSSRGIDRRAAVSGVHGHRQHPRARAT